ncbi:MAG: fibronectin type III domain-containing protein [Candidatus Micrarchaeota archaeon]
MNEASKGRFESSAVFLLLFIGLAFALTSVTINAPANNAYVNGTVMINATADAAVTSMSFFNSSNGIAWTLIGTNSTAGTTSYYWWSTVSYDQSGVQIRVNATDGSTTVTGTNTGIRVDNTKPDVTAIVNSSINELNITVTWTTDELANSSVNYGLTTDLGTVNGNSSYALSHSVVIAPLLENTIYYYNVTSCDQAGNCYLSARYSITTLDAAPQITAVTNASFTNSSFTVNWTTHEYANGSINYGTTTALGTTTGNGSNTTSHSINITGLANGTLYYYNITSCDNITVSNCNTTGPYSATTLVDSTEPSVANLLINGSSTINITQNTMINVTASATDNTNISSVLLQDTLQNGTKSNYTMTNISADLFTVLYAPVGAGLHNLTVYAIDAYSNTGSSSQSQFRSFGQFMVSANITSPYYNFTEGVANKFTITIYNNNQSAENYTINVSQQNYSAGWTVSLNGTNLSLASLSTGDIKLILTTDRKMTNYTLVYINITSNNTAYNVNYTIKFAPANISIGMLSYIDVVNTTYYWLGASKYINVTGISMWSQCTGYDMNNSNVSCGIYNNYTSVVKAGTFYNATNTCVINASGIAPGRYNFTVNITDAKNQTDYNETPMLVPGTVNVSVNNTNSVIDLTFKVSGRAIYNSTGHAVYGGYQAVNATFGTSACLGTPGPTGYFEFDCRSPQTAGTYNLTVNVTGVWNVSGVGYATLTTSSAFVGAEGKKVRITPNETSVTLGIGEKKIKISVYNNYSEVKIFNFTIKETGEYMHFGLAPQNKSLNVGAKATESFEITLTPFESIKPGTYSVVIAAEGEDESAAIAVTITGDEFGADTINAKRYLEKGAGNASTKVVILVKNNLGLKAIAEVIETIPKTVAESVSNISSFSPEINETVQADPVVKWVITPNAGEEIELSYVIGKDVSSLDSYSDPQININATIDEDTGDTTPYVPPEKPGGVQTKTILIIIIVIAAAAGAIIYLFRGKIFKKLAKEDIKKNRKEALENKDVRWSSSEEKETSDEESARKGKSAFE